MGGLTSLADPVWLLGVLVVLAIVAGYVYNETRRSKRTLKFANMPVLDSVAPPAATGGGTCRSRCSASG
ncbi:hypothetical protein MTP03_23360 [Tsukamurella sp. PLM1]|nr:hypothetical protein MTP03_23360 [Tsukamurella sp. PLM1]